MYEQVMLYKSRKLQVHHSSRAMESVGTSVVQPPTSAFYFMLQAKIVDPVVNNTPELEHTNPRHATAENAPYNSSPGQCTRYSDTNNGLHVQ